MSCKHCNKETHFLYILPTVPKEHMCLLCLHKVITDPSSKFDRCLQCGEIKRKSDCIKLISITSPIEVFCKDCCSNSNQT